MVVQSKSFGAVLSSHNNKACAINKAEVTAALVFPEFNGQFVDRLRDPVSIYNTENVILKEHCGLAADSILQERYCFKYYIIACNEMIVVMQKKCPCFRSLFMSRV